MDAGREKTLNGIAAATLSVLAGVGHLFLGEQRGYVFLASGLGLIIISKFFWPVGWLFYLSFAIFSAFDAFSFAKRGYGLF